MNCRRPTGMKRQVLQLRVRTIFNVVTLIAPMRYQKIREGDYMPATHTHHTLNDYRLIPDATYENESHSKLGIGALVVAAFLGMGAYFFYPMFSRSQDAEPVSSDMQYPSPAATESATTAGTIDSDPMPDAPNAAAAAPTIPSTASAPGASTQDSAMNRTATESKPSASPAQRAKQSVKPQTTPPSASTAPSASNATAPSEITVPAPALSPPAAADQATETAPEPMTNHSEVPANATSDEGVG